MGDLTKNISKWEIQCRCGCGLDDIDMKVAEAVQAIRTLTGNRVDISSGCRCKAHNKAEGGKSASKHLPNKVTGLCEAIDFTVVRVKPIIIYNLLDPIWKGGLGRYSTFTHIDSRGRKARWG